MLAHGSTGTFTGRRDRSESLPQRLRAPPAVILAADLVKDLTAAGAFLGGAGSIGVFIAVVFAYHQVREAQTTRNAQFASDFYRRWQHRDLLVGRVLTSKSVANGKLKEDYREAEAKWKANPDPDADYIAFDTLLNFYEEVGVVENGSGIQLRWIDATLGSIIIHGWEDWRDTIKATDRQKQPTVYENFQRLAEKLTLYRQARDLQKSWPVNGRKLNDIRRKIKKLGSSTWDPS
jgi:hypothetical protein